MCGISGLVNCGDAATLERMTSIQSHRGPDDAGQWVHRLSEREWIGIGSRRLAIQDLSMAAHMPMGTADGKIWIAYNGEVYNAPALREELRACGEEFVSHGDTEVVLRLYARLGVKCLPMLKGIFAFAIADLRASRPRVILARDYFGVKPLYYHCPTAGGLVFASELKAILEAPGVKRTVAPRALESYLAFLWVPEPDTIVEGIKKLPAGHYAIYENGRIKLTQYWDLRFPDADHRFASDETALAAELRRRVEQAVEAQLLSDVPVGAFLSGGLDSSTIVAAMAAKSDKPLHTYTITFPSRHRVGERNLDDPAVAARTARRFGAIHHELVVEPDLERLLPRLVWHMDDPTADPAIVMAYHVCRQASAQVKVILSGIGADEMFGGYRKYLANLAGRRYRALPEALRRGVLEPALRMIPPLEGTPLKAYAGWARKWARSASLDPESQFIMDATYLNEAQRRELLGRDGSGDPAQRHREAFRQARNANGLNRMLYVDSKVFLPSLNLNYNDKMSMACSIETRVPFLDHELAQWVAENVSPSQKIKGMTTKRILRRAMDGVLPEEVLRQPKASFGAPVGYWLRHDLQEMAGDILSEKRLKERGWLDSAAVLRMLEEHRSGRADWGLQIWQFLTLELWARCFLDRPEVSQY